MQEVIYILTLSEFFFFSEKETAYVIDWREQDSMITKIIDNVDWQDLNTLLSFW